MRKSQTKQQLALDGSMLMLLLAVSCAAAWLGGCSIGPDASSQYGLPMQPGIACGLWTDMLQPASPPFQYTAGLRWTVSGYYFVCGDNACFGAQGWKWWYRGVWLKVPWWLVGLLCLGIAWWLNRYRRQLRLLSLMEHPPCPRCGYDLRASRERCPECGQAVADPPRSRPVSQGRQP